MKTGCPDSSVGLEKVYICGDPKLAGGSNIDAINPNLASGSPAIGVGVAIGAITTDYNGVTRPQRPAIGAFEPALPAQAGLPVAASDHFRSGDSAFDFFE